VASIRSFIALRLPAAVVDTLDAVSTELSSCVDNIRWVKAKNIHLTLRFLGDVEESRIGGIRDAIDRVADAHRPLCLGLASIGAFPCPKKARVI
jgi:2'-5' RNA ligase